MLFPRAIKPYDTKQEPMSLIRLAVISASLVPHVLAVSVAP